MTPEQHQLVLVLRKLGNDEAALRKYAEFNGNYIACGNEGHWYYRSKVKYFTSNLLTIEWLSMVPATEILDRWTPCNHQH